jgi:hypothetical protein
LVLATVIVCAQIEVTEQEVTPAYRRKMLITHPFVLGVSPRYITLTAPPTTLVSGAGTSAKQLTAIFVGQVTTGSITVMLVNTTSFEPPPRSTMHSRVKTPPLVATTSLLIALVPLTMAALAVFGRLVLTLQAKPTGIPVLRIENVFVARGQIGLGPVTELSARLSKGAKVSRRSNGNLEASLKVVR